MRFSDLNKRLQENRIEKKEKKVVAKKTDSLDNFQKNIEKDKNLDIPEYAINKIEKKDISNIEPILEKEEKTTKLESTDKNKDIRFSIKRNVETKKISFDEDVCFRRSENSYSLMISSMKNIIESIKDSSYIFAFKEINMLSDMIINEVKENRYILNFIKYLTPKNYIISHSLNLSIIVSGISNYLGFDYEIIKKLVLSSLCIDFGMMNYSHMYLLERKFSKEDFEIIKSHIDEGVEIAKKVFAFEIELKEFVIDVIKNSHERYDGSGYFGRKGDDIKQIHQIVAISDIYEALTHKRAWRDAFEEPYAVSMIIKDYQNKFERNVMKGFLRYICIYPESSIVKLSTGEIGRVILNNTDKPTRPIVKILMDENFKEVEPYNIDLFDFPLTYIDGWVSLKELKIKNPDFYRKESLFRLWIEI